MRGGGLTGAVAMLLALVWHPAPATAAGPQAGRAGARASDAVYYTLGVLEPDRLASAWLIRRHVDPGARVLLLPEGEEAPARGVPFDLPDARWSRGASRSTFETILATEEITDPALVAVGRLVRASELAYWLLEPGSPEDRFDRTMKELALERDAEAAFDFLDRVYRAGGAVPEDGP